MSQAIQPERGAAEENFDLLLAQFEPEGLGPEGPGWQQRKSAQTRIGILEAAIDCLAAHGYARTTTQLIAETAEISRGASAHGAPASAHSGASGGTNDCGCCPRLRPRCP